MALGERVGGPERLGTFGPIREATFACQLCQDIFYIFANELANLLWRGGLVALDLAHSSPPSLPAVLLGLTTSP